MVEFCFPHREISKKKWGGKNQNYKWCQPVLVLKSWIQDRATLKLSFRREEKDTKLQETEEKIKVRDKEGKEIENTTIWC